MADAPIIIKRKAKHAIRNTLAEGQNTEDGPDDSGTSVSALVTKVKSKAKQRTKPKAALSFGEDEEADGEVFKLKKSSLSRKLALGKHPASAGTLPPNLDQASISGRSDSGPVYDKAYLSELKANTPSTRPPPPTGEHMYDTPMPIDISSVGEAVFEDVNIIGDNETIIPSESSILAAKQRRERVRMSGITGDDYITLAITKRHEDYQGPHPESRLMREDDDLGEGDDEFAEYTSAQERVALGKKAQKLEASKHRDSMKELIADADEVNEETEEWEQEQLRRGGLKVDDISQKSATKLVYKPAPIPPLTAVPTLAPALARLVQGKTIITASHAKNTASVASLLKERVQLDEREHELREVIEKAEIKRSWFSAFKEWMESVATFLDEKYPQLESLEEEHVSLLKERRDLIRQRRRADDENDLSIFLGSLPVSPGDEEHDELGRIIPRANSSASRHIHQATQISRRSRRQATVRGTDDEEGCSTDSTLPPSDRSDYHTAITKLTAKRETILSDVRAPEFRDPKIGLGKWFGEWRERFGDSYAGAWGGLGMVAAWEFWVRLELVGWNPFEDSRNLDSFSWFGALHDYSRPHSSDETLELDEEPELGPDGDLVSTVISTVVLPQISKIIEGGGLDALSADNIRRVIDLAEEIEISVEKSNPKFKNLLNTVLSVFQEAAFDAISLQNPYLALNNARFHPESIPARKRLLARRRKLLTNALRWTKYTGEDIDVGQLVDNYVRDCMLPVAENGWDVGGEDCMRKVLKSLPEEFSAAQLKARLNDS